MIEAKIVEDSLNLYGHRLTTFELTYPRFVHSEFMTHRMFSRNAASSRAIPVAKMIQMVEENPAVPIVWGKAQAGMQAYEELPPALQTSSEFLWLQARDHAVKTAKQMLTLGLHKQVINRILEPFLHITVVCSATDYANFFTLRDHSAAEPHIQALARAMKASLAASTPTIRPTPMARSYNPADAWHLPYVTAEERGSCDSYTRLVELIKCSVARCARVSYLKHDQTKATLEEEIALYDRLVGSDPKHASPAEHQAQSPTAMHEVKPSNFRGWNQYRKQLENEAVQG